MIKLLGAFLLVAAGGAAGMAVARQYSRRPVELRSLLSSIQMLETEITFAATPLAEALERVAGGSDPVVADFFRSASGEMGPEYGRTAGEAWEKAMGRLYRASSLSKRDMHILGGLGRVLGISDRDDQSKHLRLACDQLKIEAARAEEEASKNARMWNYLGFCGALAAAIVLY